MAAADVGDERAALQLVDDAVERGQPLGDQVGVVAGPEEALAALVDVVHVLVPAEARRRCGPPRRSCGESMHRAERDLEEPGQVGRAVRIGQRDRLLGRQRVAAAVGVVVDVAARRLGVQPLADVALGGAGALGQFGRRQTAGARPAPGTGRACRPSPPAPRSVWRRLHPPRGRRTACSLSPSTSTGSLDGAHDVPPGSVSGERRVRGTTARFRGAPSLWRVPFGMASGGLESRPCCSVASTERAGDRARARRARARARARRLPGGRAGDRQDGAARRRRRACRRHARAARAWDRVRGADPVRRRCSSCCAPRWRCSTGSREPQAVALEGALALRRGPAQERFAVGAATLSLLAAYAEEGPGGGPGRRRSLARRLQRAGAAVRVPPAGGRPDRGPDRRPRRASRRCSTAPICRRCGSAA